MPKVSGLMDQVKRSQIWKSVFRHDIPSDERGRAQVVLSNVFLHLHPVRMPKSGIRVRYTWCMGGLTFFIFLVEAITGILLMFYYRPTLEYAYTDIIDLGEQVPLGIMRGRATAVKNSTFGRWFLFDRRRFFGRFWPGNMRAQTPFRFW